MHPFFFDESNLGLDADINVYTSLGNADVKVALAGNSFADFTFASCRQPQRPQLPSLSHHGRACQGVYGTSHVDFSFSGGQLEMEDSGPSLRPARSMSRQAASASPRSFW